MASKVTVTGKVGPGNTVTALVVNDVTYFGIDTKNEILRVVAGGNDPSAKGQEFDIGAATTITVTVSGTDYTVVVS